MSNTVPTTSPESFTNYLLERGGAMTERWRSIDGVIGVTLGAIECAAREFADAAVRLELPVDHAISHEVEHGPIRRGTFRNSRAETDTTWAHPVWTIIPHTGSTLDRIKPNMERITRERGSLTRRFDTDTVEVKPEDLGNMHSWSDSSFMYRGRRIVVDASTRSAGFGGIRCLAINGQDMYPSEVQRLRKDTTAYPYTDEPAQPEDLFDVPTFKNLPTLEQAQRYGKNIVNAWRKALVEATDRYLLRSRNKTDAVVRHEPWVISRDKTFVNV